MAIKVVDEDLMITNPVRYARSTEDLEVGDKGEFNSAGWRINGEVIEIVTKNTHQKLYIYIVGSIEHLEWLGLEMTEDEFEAWQKEEAKRKQLKLGL